MKRNSRIEEIFNKCRVENNTFLSWVVFILAVIVGMIWFLITELKDKIMKKNTKDQEAELEFIKNRSYQIGYGIAKGVLQAICLYVFFFTVITKAYIWYENHYELNLDDTDKDSKHRSGLKLKIDYGTGLHYYEVNGNLIPRMDSTNTRQISEFWHKEGK